MPDAALAIVLHDVAPATWPDYADFVARLDALGPLPLTLLVVPDFHRQGSLADDPAFCELLSQRRAQGDELVLHGYYHDDPGPIPARPGEFVRRRILTHEGEFYPLTEDAARRRLASGMALFRRLGWPLDGFVPPAWLLGEGARAALAETPFRYTSDPAGLIRLPGFTPVPAPTLVWSARSAWRRSLSRRWNEHRLQRHADAGLLRLGLHPVDMRHAASREWWLSTLQRLLSRRRPTTKGAWLALQA